MHPSRSSHLLACFAVAFLLSACASSIPMTTRMSDEMMSRIKTSPTQTVAFEYQSNVADGLIKPSHKDTRDIQSGHPGYMHTENASLERMLRDYLSMKFTSIDNSANIKVKVVLRDFWLEQYSPDSKAKQILVALGGGEINVIIVANLEIAYELTNGGSPVTKVVRVSVDSTHVAGVGTGTSTSYAYRGRDSIQFRVADAINAANNKAIVMLNLFLETNHL